MLDNKRYTFIFGKAGWKLTESALVSCEGKRQQKQHIILYEGTFMEGELNAAFFLFISNQKHDEINK